MFVLELLPHASTRLSVLVVARCSIDRHWTIELSEDGSQLILEVLQAQAILLQRLRIVLEADTALVTDYDNQISVLVQLLKTARDRCIPPFPACCISIEADLTSRCDDCIVEIKCRNFDGTL